MLRKLLPLEGARSHVDVLELANTHLQTWDLGLFPSSFNSAIHYRRNKPEQNRFGFHCAEFLTC
jgi:hypothetical protein